MHYKLIVCDIDGTLVNDDRKMSAFTFLEVLFIFVLDLETTWVIKIFRGLSELLGVNFRGQKQWAKNSNENNRG